MSDTRHLPFADQLIEAQLADIVNRHYGFRPAAIIPMGGYSNINYSVQDAAGQDYVLRIARTNRSADSIQAEHHVLKSLQQVDSQLVPQLVPTRNQKLIPTQDHGIATINPGGTRRFIQLSRKLPGTIDCLWWQQCSFDKLRQVFAALAKLHKLMSQIALPATYTPLPFRYNLPEQPPDVLRATPTGIYVHDKWPLFRQSAIRLQADMQRHYPWEKARYQWIHGDVQLENLLFDQDRFSGFLDFERVCVGPCEQDVVFSAFRVCKEGNTDDPFLYDRDRLAAAIDAYQAEEPGLEAAFFEGYEKFWKPFFCLDQAMVYLDNAFDGIWQLAEGIGFLPCFDEVLRYPTVD